MTQDNGERVDRLRRALKAGAPSARLQAAMVAGLHPQDGDIEILVERCAEEPDFFVRDMLTWALIQHDRPRAMERVLPELRSPIPQARSQALHTLSKLGDRHAWPAITEELLRDPDDEVARAAWRAAASLVPTEHAAALAETLATQFNRGDRALQRSLSQALATLGEAAVPVVHRATGHRDAGVRTHAVATERLMLNPDEGFDVAVEAARRLVALRGAPLVEDVAL